MRAQREHGLDEAGYGYWGFSPSSQPTGGYREYGVDAIGMEPAGYPADKLGGVFKELEADVVRRSILDTGVRIDAA